MVHFSTERILHWLILLVLAALGYCVGAGILAYRESERARLCKYEHGGVYIKEQNLCKVKREAA